MISKPKHAGSEGAMRKRKCGRGDRKRRWKSSCVATGCFMLGFATVIAFSATDYKGLLIACVVAIPAFIEFRSAHRGWKISYKLPPKYYRDIKSSNPITREMAKICGEEVLKEAKNPNRQKYAFVKPEAQNERET